MKFWILSLAIAGAAVAYVGCSDDHGHDDDDAHTDGGHTTKFAACTEITASCHEVDTGEGAIHDCHDKAHEATSEAACTSIKDNCLKICAEAKVDGGGHDSDGGDGGEEHDGGH